jgi:hypothetical protein
MALFRDAPVHEVARRLKVCAQGLAATTFGPQRCDQARSGSVPILLSGCARPVLNGAERYDDDAWHDLQVFAVDGAPAPRIRPSLRDDFAVGIPE